MLKWIVLIMMSLTLVGLAAADVPGLVSFQGRLTNTLTGDPVTDGNYNFTFKLYTTPVGGVASWTETQLAVPVAGGLYHVLLGSVTPLTSISFRQQLYLGIVVGADPEMAVRYQLASSPSALDIPDTIDYLSMDRLGLVPQGVGAPTAVRGYQYYDGVTNTMMYYNGTAWIPMSGGPTGATGATGPAGGLWTDDPSNDRIYNNNAASNPQRTLVMDNGDMRVTGELTVNPAAPLGGGTWTGSVAIVDNTCPSGNCGAATYNQTSVVVSGSPDPITSVRILIDITHTFDSDLNIWVVGPTGVEVCLSDDNGSSNDNYTQTIFSDAAATSITTGTAPFTGSFQPESPLSAFNGLTGNGTWTLRVCDDLGGDVGTINQFTVLLTGPAPHAGSGNVQAGTFNGHEVGNAASNIPVSNGTLSTNLNADMLDNKHASDFVSSANGITGSGAATQVAYFTGANTIASNANLFWDNTNGRLGIGTSSPIHRLEVAQPAALLSGDGSIHAYAMMLGGEGAAMSGYSNETGTSAGTLTYARGLLATWAGGAVSGNAGVWGHAYGTGSNGYGVYASHGGNPDTPDVWAYLAGSSYAGYFNGSLFTTGQYTSTLAIGTAPFVVTSTTLNTNLNADLLDGLHASAFAPVASVLWTDAGTYLNPVNNLAVRIYDDGQPNDIFDNYTNGANGIGINHQVTGGTALRIDESMTAIGEAYGIYVSDNSGGTTQARTRHDIYAENHQYQVGTNYTPSESHCAVAGADFDGGAYNFGVGGWNYLDNNLSGGVIGANWSGTIWSSLAYKDAAGTIWAGYFNGNIFTNSRYTSTLATGTSPFNVTSTTLNTNLNADLLDGLHASSFAPAASVLWNDAGIYMNPSAPGASDVRIYDEEQLYGIYNYQDAPAQDGDWYGYYGYRTGSDAANGYGVYSNAQVANGSGMGGTFHGVFGEAEWGSVNYGVRGHGYNATTTNYGVYGEAGQPDASYSSTNIGIYGTASGTGTNWAGYFEGNIFTTGQYTSTLAIGTAPFNVTSTTLNTNLNADLLDGLHAGSFWQGTGSGTTNYITKWTGATALGTSVIYDDGTNVGVGTTTPGTARLYVQNYIQHAPAVRGTDQSGAVIYAEGQLGVLNHGSLPYNAYNIGVLGIKPNNGSDGVAVYGWNADGSNPDAYAMYAIANGVGGTTNYGIYATALGATNNWAGFFEGKVNITGSMNTANIIGQTSNGQVDIGVPAAPTGVWTVVRTVTITKERADTPIIIQASLSGMSNSTNYAAYIRVQRTVPSTAVVGWAYGGAFSNTNRCGAAVTGYDTGIAAGTVTYTLEYDAGNSTALTSALVIYELKQ